jgi:hypothetical protein
VGWQAAAHDLPGIHSRHDLSYTLPLYILSMCLHFSNIVPAGAGLSAGAGLPATGALAGVGAATGFLAATTGDEGLEGVAAGGRGGGESERGRGRMEGAVVFV